MNTQKNSENVFQPKNTGDKKVRLKMKPTGLKIARFRVTSLFIQKKLQCLMGV